MSKSKFIRSQQVTPQLIREFMRGRWGKATLLRHQAHVAACKSQECEELIEPFSRFVDEVINAPEAIRDEMLAMTTELEPYEARVSYPAYTSPTPEEQKLGFYSVGMGRKMR